MLTTTVATTSTISGEYVEKILGLIPQDLEVRGVYTLTRSLDRPLAGFSAKPSTGPAPLVVEFLDRSQGNPSSWVWGFGDGTTSAEQHPTHTYEQPGLYTVTLKVSNLFGSHTLTKVSYILVEEPTVPTALFSATPVTGTVPLTVTFSDQASGCPTSWIWTFGDGETANVPNPTHTYVSSASYTVTLTVSDTFGSNTLTVPDCITVREANRIYLPLMEALHIHQFDERMAKFGLFYARFVDD